MRALLHDELAGDEVLVVSNREPYIHNRTGKGIEVQRPASGALRLSKWQSVLARMREEGIE